jgi:hypothetical protein
VFLSGHLGEPEPEVILNRQELANYRQNLLKLSTSNLEHEYRRVHQDCRIEGPRFPQLAALQQLVTLWKVLRGIRLRKSQGTP